ncbi:MAG: T9SS type A sorting domain-containing protein [Chitinispirillaceae bacterium]|nr:T9SS type A sorting domain-containing protein [Chitinispirillaceae bacterium]
MIAQSIIANLTPEKLAYYEQQKLLFKKSHPITPFVRHSQYTAYKSSPMVYSSEITRVLILQNPTLYANNTAKTLIDRYCTDIGRAFNCNVEVEVTEGGSPSEVRALLKEYYDDGGLDGVIIMGDQPVQWYDIQNPRFDPGSFACDLYYMDLDGSWSQANSQGEFTWHADGSGDIMPEIFCSRIHLSSMSDFGNEVTLLGNFLDKSHNYWLGNFEMPQHGAAFVQETWTNWAHLNTVKYVYGESNSDLFNSQSTANSTAYINNGLLGNNTILHLWCHSGVHGHSFDFGGSLSDVQLYEIESKPLGYAIDACHIGAWPEGGGSCISGSYVFGKSKRALIILSGTRSGQSIGSDGRVLFEELGQNICFGKAFKDWMEAYFKQKKGSSDHVDDTETKAWNYGYVLMGDPMVCFKRTPVAIKKENMHATGHEYLLRCSGKNSTTIRYHLPKADVITLKLYSLSGKNIQTLVHSFTGKGSHTIDLAGLPVAEGSYIVQLNAGSTRISKKITVF